MKLEGTRLSKKDGVSTVYIFAMNINEVELFDALLLKALLYTPQVISNMQVHGRLRQMSKTLSPILRTPKLLHKRLRKKAQFEKDNN